MTELILVRHGETEWNATHRAQGQADIPLNEAGRRQAERVAEELSHRRVAAVYSSDLGRALDTARAIAKALDLTVEVDPDLREIDQGEWEGLETAAIGERWPELWGEARHYSRRPGGESPGEVRARCMQALHRIVAAHPDDPVVVVTHGGPIRWLSAEAAGLDDRGSARLRGVGNGGWVTLNATLDGARVVLGDLRRSDGRVTEVDDINA